MKRTCKIITIILCVLVLLGVVSYFLHFKDLGFWQLNDAIKKQDVTEVKRLLESGVDPNDYEIVDSWVWRMLEGGPEAPIIEACLSGNSEIVELLIRNGASLERDDKMGISPWQAAVWKYHPTNADILKILNKNGEMWYNEPDGHPIFIVGGGTDFPIKNKLGNKIIGSEFSMELVENSIECIDILMDSTTINLTDKMDRTLLIWAVICDNTYLVNYLMSNGCDINLKDCKGKTALDYAVEAGNEEIIALLKG